MYICLAYLYICKCVVCVNHRYIDVFHAIGDIHFKWVSFCPKLSHVPDTGWSSLLILVDVEGGFNALILAMGRSTYSICDVPAA